MLHEDHYEETINLLCRCLFKRFDDALTKGWILTALQKLNRGVPSDQTRDFISRFSTSRNEDLQQRCYEFAGSCTKISSSLNFRNNLKLSVSFDFLDPFIRQEVIKGCKPYNPEKNRRGLNYLINKSRNEEYKAGEAITSMRLEAYSAPVQERFSVRPVDVRQDQNELQVKAKAWSKQGYTGSVPVTEPPKSSVLSHNPQKAQKKSQFMKSEKDIAKESFAQGLFGGIDQQERPQKSQSNIVSAPAPQIIKKKEPENLLDF